MAFLPGAPLPLPRPCRGAARSSRAPAMIRAPPQRPLTAVPTAPPATAPHMPSAASPAAPAVPAPPFVAAPVAPALPSAFAPAPAPAPAPAETKPRRRAKSPPRATPAKVSDAASRDRLREFYYDDLPSPSSRAGSAVANPQAPSRRRVLRTADGKVSDAGSAGETVQLAGDDGAVEDKTAKKKKKKRKAKVSTKRAAVDDSIRTYLHEIGEVKLLNAESEVNLAREIAKLLDLERTSARLMEKNGTEPTIAQWAAEANMDIESFRDVLRRGLRAKEHMVAANLRLVVSIAKKYLNRGLSFQDLIQEGSMGLIRGAEKFDGNKGFKFSTYATWWIRQAITRAIADHSRPIRLPVHVNDTIAAMKKTTKHLHSELGRPPSEVEIADRMQIPIEKLRFMSRSSRSTISLETPIGKEGGESSATLGSFIVWEGDTPEQSTMKSLLREDLENVLNTLSPRERDVVRMRYGFDDGKMKTLEEIGSLFAVTRERIRQIEAKALRKLRHPNRNAVLREYVYEEQ